MTKKTAEIVALTDERVALNYALKDVINYINQMLAKNYRGMHESIDRLYCARLKRLRDELRAELKKVNE